MIAVETGVIAAILTGFVSLMLLWKLHRRVRRAEAGFADVCQERAAKDAELSERIVRLTSDFAAAEKNAQWNIELLRDGRLTMPVRARALRKLRGGAAAEVVASELGLARSEVMLLDEVATAFARQVFSVS